jgi:hypothetical protein
MTTVIPIDARNTNVDKSAVVFGPAQSTQTSHCVSYHAPVSPPRVLQLPKNTTATDSLLSVTRIHLGGETAPGWVILDRFNRNFDILGEHSPKDVSAGVFASISAPMEKPHMDELSREERVRIAKSAFGMWADREDLGDTVEYVTRLRASWERTAEDPEVD